MSNIKVDGMIKIQIGKKFRKVKDEDSVIWISQMTECSSCHMMNSLN